jgi:hypothetical protein
MQSIKRIFGIWIPLHRFKVLLVTLTILAIPIGFLLKNPDYSKTLLNLTNNLKQSLQDIQVAEHFVRYVFAWRPTRGDCDDYEALQPAGCRPGTLGLAARVPAALLFTGEKVLQSAWPAKLFALVVLLFAFASWYGEPKRNFKEFLLIPLYAILLAWLLKLLILGVLSVFGWVVQLLVLLTIPLAGFLKLLEFVEMSQKLREATVALDKARQQKG